MYTAIPQEHTPPHTDSRTNKKNPNIPLYFSPSIHKPHRTENTYINSTYLHTIHNIHNHKSGKKQKKYINFLVIL